MGNQTAVTLEDLEPPFFSLSLQFPTIPFLQVPPFILSREGPGCRSIGHFLPDEIDRPVQPFALAPYGSDIAILACLT